MTYKRITIQLRVIEACEGMIQAIESKWNERRFYGIKALENTHDYLFSWFSDFMCFISETSDEDFNNKWMKELEKLEDIYDDFATNILYEYAKVARDGSRMFFDDDSRDTYFELIDEMYEPLAYWTNKLIMFEH